MSFRGRLVLAVSAVTALTLGGAFAVVSGLVNRDQQQQLDRALLHEVGEEAIEVAALGGRELAISDRPGPAANDVGPLTKYAAIYDGAGNALAMTPTFGGEPLQRSALPPAGNRCFDLWFRGEHLRGVIKAVPGRSDLELLLAVPRTDLDSDAAFLRRAMVAVLAVAIVWAALVATWVIRRLTRHHQTLAEVVRRVASGDRSARMSLLSRDPEIAQLERDINDMIARIEALVRSQQRFIAHAAHELRSPLASLLGELSHAQRRPRDADGYRATIDEALAATRQLNLLTEDLLTLVRLDAGPENEPPRELLPAMTLLESAERTIAAAARERGVRLRFSETELAIEGHLPDLTRMLRNLLENAIRHSPPGGCVVVLCRALDGLIEIGVHDQGSGVAAEDRERIFEPFYRGPRERANGLPGTGLGLAIAREIARAHGGNITLADQPPPGATFLVTLPLLCSVYNTRQRAGSAA